MISKNMTDVLNVQINKELSVRVFVPPAVA